MTKTGQKKDQNSQPFFQARDDKNEVATFIPGHNAALKDISWL